jgi:hypothetical protein
MTHTIEVRRAVAILGAALVFAMTMTIAFMLTTGHAHGSYCEVADANARIVYCAAHGAEGTSR